MVPDIYTHEKLALQHRQTLLCEAKCERMLAGSSTQAAHILERLQRSLGLYLIALGTWLQRFGQREKAVEYQAEPRS
jgi:hypothetical protein